MLNFNKKLKGKISLYKSLTSNYGIGITRAIKIYKLLGINKRKPSRYLLYKHTRLLNKRCSRLFINEQLKNYRKQIHSFAYSIRRYRGLRNRFKLPCRGQRTHTNAKTKKKKSAKNFS